MPVHQDAGSLEAVARDRDPAPLRRDTSVTTVTTGRTKRSVAAPAWSLTRKDKILLPDMSDGVSAGTAGPISKLLR